MSHGGQTMTGRLERVLLRSPPAEVSDWRRFGWREEPDAARLAAEHEELRGLLSRAGAEVIVTEPTSLDAIYVFDPVIVCDRGAVLLRPGKPERREEVEAMEADLARGGVPIVARLDKPAHAEGGDTAWLDERTLLAGRGYRTNPAGIEALRAILGVDVLGFDLPHWNGRREVMHLLSLFSPLAGDLVVAYPRIMPTALVQLFEERGMEIVEVPDEEFPTMGSNVLALAPRVALMAERNVETRRRLERVGVEVLVYRDDELSKGDGGPTCLTQPLLRS